MLNDNSNGRGPIQRKADGLFGPNSVAWRVHGDVSSMMVGGIAALMLQMLHPAVLAGVWDHSGFRSDMHGRLKRTASFIALTTYGGRTEAQAVIERVRNIHSRIKGTLPDGTCYTADDPHSLAWVHVTGSMCFLSGWRRYGEPAMSAADRDRYFAEMAQVAQALGANPVPTTETAAQRLIAEMRPFLRSDARTREVSRLVLSQPAQHPLAAPVQSLMTQAAIDLMPAWARQMHSLRTPIFARPLIRTGALGVAELLRWALR